MSIFKAHGYWRDGWVAVGIVSAIVGGLILLLVAIGVPIYFAEKASCERSGDRLGTDSLFDIWSGCFIEVNGKFVPLDNVRITDDGDVLGASGDAGAQRSTSGEVGQE